MIETHVVNALLLPAYRQEQFFKVLNFINGLVAPSFLFCAGFALAITLNRRWDEYTGLRTSFWKYLSRIAFILIVGYSLHLPFFSFRRLLALTDESAWIAFFQSDILHVIALTLALLLMTAVLVKKKERFFTVSMIIAFLLIFSAPIVCEGDYTQYPAWFRSFLTTQYRSPFPLFPWSAFLICGAIVSFHFMKNKEQHREPLFILRLSFIALGLTAGAIIAELLPFTLYPNHDFWRASPEFFFVRLGIVILFLTGLWWLEQRQKPHEQKPGITISPIPLFGQESLIVYVIHLLIVYGYTYKWSFVRQFSQTLNYSECMGLFIGLTVAMFLLAFIWHWLKSRNMRIAKWIQYAVFAAIVITFLVRTE